jgi:hypothetical protein
MDFHTAFPRNQCCSCVATSSTQEAVPKLRVLMEFFPMAEAGWRKTNKPYWANQKQFEKWVEAKEKHVLGA